MTAGSWMLGIGSVFTLVSLAFVAISFATDEWIVVTVNREAATDKSDGIYFSRTRGLFRTCYKGNDTTFLDGNPNVLDGNCLTNKGYELSRDPATINFGNDYEIRIHLMRSHFAFMVLAMFLLIVGTIVGIVGCWRLKVMILQISGLLVFVGAFFAAGAMAFFHGYDFLEREKLVDTARDFRGYIEKNNVPLADISYWAYGYSYILGWMGVGCAGIGAMLYLCASFSVSSDLAKEKRREKKERKMKPTPNPYDAGYGNAGYWEDPYSQYSQGYGGAAGANSYYQGAYPTAGYPAAGYSATGYPATTYPASSYPAITY